MGNKKQVFDDFDDANVRWDNCTKWMVWKTEWGM